MHNESTTGYKKLLEPANLVLTAAVLVALAFMVYMSRTMASVSQENQLLREDAARFSALEVGDYVPSLTATDIEGARARIDFDSAPKHLLFVFTTTCAACAQQMPVWKQLARELRPEDCVVRGLSVNPADETKAYFNGDAIPTLAVPGERFKRAFRVKEVPKTILVSREGVVEWMHNGILTPEQVDELRAQIGGGREVARERQR